MYCRKTCDTYSGKGLQGSMFVLQTKSTFFALLECRDLGDVFGMDCGPAVETEVLCLNETFIDLCPRTCGFCEKRQKIVFDPSGKIFLQWFKKPHLETSLFSELQIA